MCYRAACTQIMSKSKPDMEWRSKVDVEVASEVTPIPKLILKSSCFACESLEMRVRDQDTASRDSYLLYPHIKTVSQRRPSNDLPALTLYNTQLSVPTLKLLGRPLSPKVPSRDIVCAREPSTSMIIATSILGTSRTKYASRNDANTIIHISMQMRRDH